MHGRNRLRWSLHSLLTLNNNAMYNSKHCQRSSPWYLHGTLCSDRLFLECSLKNEMFSETVLSCIFAWSTHIDPQKSTLCAYLCNTAELCSWMNQSRWRNRLINDSETHKHGHLSPPTGVTMSTLCAYLCNTVELCSWMNQSRWRNRLINDSETHKHGHLSPPTGSEPVKTNSSAIQFPRKSSAGIILAFIT